MTNDNGIGKTIQPIFSPAISVLNRMGYTRKFTLLWLMSLVAVAVVVYSLIVSLERVIRPSQMELQGLALMEPVSSTVQLIQLHRGLSTALLGGNETMKDRRAAKEREAADAFKAMEGKLPPRLISREDFLRIKADWEKLRKEGLFWTADENFAAHTRLIGQLQSFEGLIADDYALILDAELDTYYLIDTNVNKLPHVLEHLGQLRAYGTGILAGKRITEPQKAKLNGLIAGLDSTLNELSTNIEKTGRYSPAVRKSLLAAYDGIAGSARQITGLVESDILAGHFATHPDIFLDMATAEIDNGYTQMHQVLLPTTKTLIEARIARAEDTLLMTVSSALLLFLLAVYISVGMYYAIVGSIRSLVRSAHTFAEGDLSVRVKLDTRDELSYIGDSFNKMAEGFNALLEARKQAEEALEQESYRNKMLLRTASDGIHILDIDGNVVQVNDAFCRMLGYTATEMLSMNVAQWDAQWTTEQIKANIDMLDSNASMIETMHRRRDGSIIDVEISVVKVNIDGQQLVYCSSRDVTERKQAEKALLDKEHLLSESQRIAHIGSWRSDLTGQISWTDETYHIYRVLPDTFTPNAESFFNLIHPEDRPAMRAWVDACAAGRKPGDLEFRINMSDGTVRFLSGRGELQYDAENRPSHMTGTVQDITERKRAEEALRKSKDLLQSVVENAPVRIFWKDRDSRYLGCNTHFAKAAGHSSPDELIGKTDFDMWRKDLAELYRAGDKEVMDSGIAKLNFEEPGTTPDGKTFWARTSKVPLRDESNRVIGILGIYEDITERKQAEVTLKESERVKSDLLEKLNEAQQLAIIGSWEWDLQTKRVWWSDETYQIFGVTPQDYVPSFEANGKFIHPDDFGKYVKFFEHSFQTGEPLDFEARLVANDGLLKHCHAKGKIIYDDSGQQVRFIGTIMDITERKQAEDSLRKLSLAVEQSPNSIVITDLDANIEYVNDSFVRTSGYSRADLIGQNPRILHSGKNPKAIYDDLWAHMIRGEVWHGELINRRKDGREYIEKEIISPVRQADGRVTHYLAIKEDITERKQAERSLVESKEKLHAVIETALDAVVQMDAAGIITGWNAQAEKIFGWPREEALGRMMHETIIPSQYREAHKQGLKRFLASGEGAILNSRIEMTGLRRDGHEFPVELAVVPIKTADKHEFNAFIRDITDRKKAEDLIWKQANFDMLTGLPNRHMFYDRLTQEIRKAERTSLTMALLYIDLDHFKDINDTLGHSMGDILLVEAARRISACVRETDTVARLGGDEFIIVLTELNEVSRIDTLTQNILHELAEPFRLESEVVYLSASIGITLYPHDTTAMEELIKNADQAMYAAKGSGRNRFSYFTQSMQQIAQAKLRLTNDLRGALAASEFRVYYQPIVELATGHIHKAEALIRWQHPARGMVSPADFIPLAEETGLIVEIGDWVFREAARQAKRWGALCGHEFQISVNMSPVQFHNGGSPCQTWPVFLQELGLPGQCLVIEITEGLLLNEETGVKDKLLRFHDAGIQISLDDFGTGYSSLSYLQKFDIDYLKIDQSFTRGLEPGSKNMALSEAIIVMSQKLDMKVIAEGVETEAQHKLLAAAGCDYGQGYLFSRPVPAEKFEELLKDALTGGFQAQ